MSVSSDIFYQQEPPIFHPKIYVFEGTKEVKIIIGSSNLTRRGLFTNVESSMLIEFDSNDKDGLAFLSKLKDYYKSLFDFSDPNLFKISTSVITEFYSNGIIPDETTRRSNFRNKSTTTSSPTSTSINTLVIPKRVSARTPSKFPVKPRKAATPIVPHVKPQNTPPVIIAPVIQPQKQRVLIWKKLSLSSSDAQNVPTGTNGTGNLKLSQASFRLDNVLINQETYFRNQVFQNLIWARTKPTSSTYEETICNFDITILGTSYGVQSLKLSFDPIRISNQRNTPSWLHWGNVLISILQQTNVTGRTLNLYQLNQSFSIEIV